MTMIYKIIAEKNLPEAELEIDVEVSYESLLPYKKSAIKHISEKISVPGFRTGHVPENIVLQKVGEMHVLEEASYDVIEKIFPEILKEKKLETIGDPKISITKVAPDNPLCFKIIVSITPNIKLPDYRKIAETENSNKSEATLVDEKEVNDFIDNVRKSFSKIGAKDQDTESSADTKKTEKVLPELNGEFVKKFGNFKDVEEFKVRIKENLLAEKIQKNKEKRRIVLAEKILEKTDLIVPKILIESELNKMVARFHDDIGKMGMQLEGYLKNVKKTKDELYKDWRPEATKRGKLQLVLNSIALAEKIDAPKNEVDAEMKHLLEHYKNADENRSRTYVEMMITNEKVFEFLESIK